VENKPWLEEEWPKLVDQRKQAILLWFQNINEIAGDKKCNILN